MSARVNPALGILAAISASRWRSNPLRCSASRSSPCSLPCLAVEFESAWVAAPLLFEHFPTQRLGFVGPGGALRGGELTRGSPGQAPDRLSAWPIAVSTSSIPTSTARSESVLIATPHAQGTDTAGHGTHIAGSIAGNGSTVRGMAPQSRLVVQSLLQAKGSIDVPLDLGQLFDQAKSAGAQIHNNSWSIKAARPSSSRSQNTTVTSPSTAASVIVTPNSTVRTIVSATTAAGRRRRLRHRAPREVVGTA